jgi:hypothetical protein
MTRVYAAFKSSSKSVAGDSRRKTTQAFASLARHRQFPVILFLTLALLRLFIFYSVFIFYRSEMRNRAVDGNIRINGTGEVVFPHSIPTGQASVFFQMPEPIDSDTPQDM